ncbi:MAG TPA: cytochrome c biogenesis protein CcdA [Cyclobacteriaceae bacterium]|nr:cytochrome c biogenesis protein CcdA [Cyclobacteriaceae bacterium]
MKIFTSLMFCLVMASTSSAQIIPPPKWKYEASKTEVKPGDEVDIIFKAEIASNWYIYSNDFDEDCGPLLAKFFFNSNNTYQLIGDVVAINASKKMDEIFECEVKYHKGTAEFRQKVKILSANPKISGTHEYQMCSDIDGKCVNFEDDFTIAGIKVIAAVTETPKQENVITSAAEQVEIISDEVVEPKTEVYAKSQGPIIDPELKIDNPADRSMIIFMVFSFLAGLAALLTPCVFPMIPMTVTYFTGQGKTVRKALIYGFSIIGIYTLVGAAIAPLMGPETANHLSTEWLPNIIFFLVFLIFGLAFLGLFEITLPSSLVNKVDKQADKGGLVGIFFMAFTLVLVSFSCTGPIVGSILVTSAGGEVLKPIMGMFAFSAAFAIPFTLFAIFPGWLSSLPKSGGWLNSVKVVLGFLELALAFKFLSIADQAFHWRILDREVNIAIWIVIFAMLGLYLLGKIRLPHDSKLEFISVPRLMLAIITFTFVVYLIPGLWGAPLKMLAGYLPPMYTHDFDLTTLGRQGKAPNQICDDPKYADFLHLPHGLQGYFDYEQALSCAREQGKPLFIDFTGHGCTNCREMEAVVWADPAVLQRLSEDYVIVALYVDDKTELPESQWYTSAYDNKVKKTIGKQNADLQITRLQNNAQPFYVLLGKDERVLVTPYGYDRSVEKFVKFLDEGKQKYELLYE